jgi:hypothetical protein
MAGEFKIRTGLQLGNPNSTKPVRFITDSSSFTLDASGQDSLATVEAIKNFTDSNFVPKTGENISFWASSDLFLGGFGQVILGSNTIKAEGIINYTESNNSFTDLQVPDVSFMNYSISQNSSPAQFSIFSGDPSYSDVSVYRPIDVSTIQADFRLFQGGAISAPAYDASGLEQNGTIDLMWLSEDNTINFGTDLEILESLSVGNDPGIVPLVNMNVTYESNVGDRQGISITGNYNPLLTTVVESDGAGGYDHVGTVLAGPLIQTKDDVKIPAGSWRQRIVGENLVVEKFDGINWKTINSWIPVQEPPVAYDLEISAPTGYNTGDSLTANYTYYDINGDAESGTTFEWFRADDETGTNKTSLNAFASTYLITSSENGYYITCDITPISDMDPSVGSTYTAPYVGPCTNV